jgi:rubrerythrin
MDGNMTIRQVLEMAIEREMQAVQFYHDLSLRAEEPTMRALYCQLAEEEFKHKSRLEMEMLKEGLVVRRLGQLDDVGDAEYAAELSLPPNAEYKDLVEMGVKKERRAFRFYACLAGLVPDKNTRNVLFELAEEEARHMIQFESERSRLVAKGQ